MKMWKFDLQVNFFDKDFLLLKVALLVLVVTLLLVLKYCLMMNRYKLFALYDFVVALSF